MHAHGPSSHSNTVARRASPKHALTPLLGAALLAVGCMHAPIVRADACRLAQVANDEALVQVPFEVVDGRIYVQAQVNGRGPYRFAVDTGASGLARADASLVATLGLRLQGQAGNSDGVRTAQADTTHLASLALGGLVRYDFDVITRDYSGRKSPEAAFSGIIAREFFGDGLLVIDYPKQVLSFTRARALATTDPGVLAYERAFRVPVSIGGLNTVGNLDTGANVNFVLPKALYDQVGRAYTLGVRFSL